MEWLVLKLARLSPTLDKWLTNYFWKRQQRNMQRFVTEWDVAVEDVSFVDESLKGNPSN